MAYLSSPGYHSRFNGVPVEGTGVQGAALRVATRQKQVLWLNWQVAGPKTGFQCPSRRNRCPGGCHACSYAAKTGFMAYLPGSSTSHSMCLQGHSRGSWCTAGYPVHGYAAKTGFMAYLPGHGSHSRFPPCPSRGSWCPGGCPACST